MRQFFDYPITLNTDTLRKLGALKSLRIGLSYLYSLVFPIRDEKNLEQFFINRFGRELYTTFFKSYTEKVWGVDCERISAEWGAQRIKGLSISTAVKHVLKKLWPGRKAETLAQKHLETSLIEQFLYPKFGPGQMWEEVAEKICVGGGEIRRHLSVEGVNHNDAGNIISVRVRHSDTGHSETIPGDYFFSTMPVKDLITSMNPPAPAAVQAVSKGLVYRDFITVGVLCKKLTLTDKDGIAVKDNWIYIQEPDVFVGRIQIFNNWSSSLVADPDTAWIGLEYFCNEGDQFWQRSDTNLIELAKDELTAMKMVARSDVIDATVIRVPKTYPAYFGTYDRFSEIVEWTDKFSNLFLVGRNGMHKYNNQDHSMLTAMTAVDNIVTNVASRDNLWALNAEQEYHEQATSQSKAKTDLRRASDRPLKTFLQFGLISLLFGAALCIPAVNLSLWLDEILQLILTRGHMGWSLLNGVAGSAGGVPLGYLTQAACIHPLGYSVFVSRLPSILSAVLSCFGVGVLAAQAKVQRPFLTLLLFCLLPLQVRYSAEARPYEQALCLTIWASVVFLHLVARPSVLTSLVFALISALAIYTQPFAFFIMLAQLLWVTLVWAKRRTPQLKRALWLSALGVFVAGMSFLPWFSFARRHWHQAIAASIPSRIDFRTLLVLAHEITGGGYIGFILLAAFIVIGLSTKLHSRADRSFWAAMIAVPTVLTLMSDEHFGYFFATRQLIFLLPPLVILTSYGYQQLRSKSTAISVLSSLALAATLLIGNAHYFAKPRENWQRASDAIASQVQPSKACYVTVPNDASTLMEFFNSKLRIKRCPNTGLSGFDVILVATAHYSSKNELQASVDSLFQGGFEPLSVLVDSEPTVRVWRRKASS